MLSYEEPDWVLEQDIERKKRELLADEEALETRLRDIRRQEADAKRKQTRRDDVSDDRRTKKRVRSHKNWVRVFECQITGWSATSGPSIDL